MVHFVLGESIVPLDLGFYTANVLSGSSLCLLKAVVMQKTAVLPCHSLVTVSWAV